LNSLRKGFTLIELLVVIAIIAILAAILFPVFAQAKTAAKAAASISNNKQIVLGQFMYMGDTDDKFVPTNNWDDSGNFNGYSSWIWSVLPYIKSADLFEDPLGPKIPRNTEFGYVNQVTITATYGYNYTAVSPFEGDDPVTVPTPKSQSSLGSPASTVLLTGRFDAVSESNLGYSGYYSYGEIGPDTSVIVDPPDCGHAPNWCFDNWGVDSFWGLDDYVGIKTFEAGKLTGGVSFRSGEKATVGFADGSVRKMSPGALAAGTNWTKTIQAADIQTTDVEKYLWDDK